MKYYAKSPCKKIFLVLGISSFGILLASDACGCIPPESVPRVSIRCLGGKGKLEAVLLFTSAARQLV